MIQTKQLMIDAVIGKAFLSPDDAVRMEQRGFAEFSGDKWKWLTTPPHLSWKWNKEALGKLSVEQLVDLWMREG